MKVFGWDVTVKKALSAVGGSWRNTWRTILESYPGAWQRNHEEKIEDLLRYPTLYACLRRISEDIGKLPYTLQSKRDDGVWELITNPAYSPVLNDPNHYQTPGQFREQWILSKLTQGNTYILKGRDARGVVRRLYPLDPERVIPMVSSETGAVFYQLNTDAYEMLPADYPYELLTVPASEIIHDRCMAVYHPLIGIPPLAAAYWPALKNMKIMRSATEFFANNAQPGGLLTAPAGMTEEDAKKIQDYWTTSFNGNNAGRVAIIGADMKFTPFAMKSIDSQMIEQLRYGDEQICQPFGVPPFMVGIGQIPSGLGVDGIYQLYYQNALQGLIERMEELLDRGLRIESPLGVWLDLDPLLRMDEGKRADVAVKLVGGGVETPNEGRQRFNLAPLAGGDTVYMQQQDFPLDQVRLNKIGAPAPAPAEPEPAEESDGELEDMKSYVMTQRAIEAMRKSYAV